MRNLLTRVPKSAQNFVAAMVRTIFAQPDAATVREQHARIVEQLQARFPEAAALLDEAAADPHAFTGLPKEHWRQIWSTDEKVKSPAPPPGVESCRARVTPDQRAGRGDGSPAAQDCRSTASESLPGGGTRACLPTALLPVRGELLVGEFGLLAEGSFAGSHLFQVVGVGRAALAAV
jgi:Transposase, Mutator family